MSQHMERYAVSLSCKANLTWYRIVRNHCLLMHVVVIRGCCAGTYASHHCVNRARFFANTTLMHSTIDFEICLDDLLLESRVRHFCLLFAKGVVTYEYWYIPLSIVD